MSTGASMRAVGWPHRPDLFPDDTARVLVVAGSRPKNLMSFDSRGAETGRPKLTQHDLDVALLTTPRNNEWGTMLALIKAPSLGGGPVPVAQRAGATLWFADNSQDTSPTPGHAVEWVTPGDWYLVASHMSTERHWFDVVGWGTGWGSTTEADLTDLHADTGLTFIGLGEPIVMAKLCFHNRTFTHDEIVSQADARIFPGDPTITWDLDDEVLQVLGTRRAALSWDAPSPRARRRALQVDPARVAAWETEWKVPSKPAAMRINRSGDGFVLQGARRRTDETVPTVSLMNTPFPSNDD